MRTGSAQYRIIALCLFAFLASMVARVVISPVVPDITTDLEVSTGVIGLALSGMWAAYAVTQFPSGVLASRYGERIIILVAIGCTAAASLALALSPTYPVFLLLAVVLGGSAGLVYSAGALLVTKQSTGTGRAIGIYISGGPIAGLAAPPLAAIVGAQYNWRAAIALGAITAVIVAIVFARGVDSTPATNPTSSIREQASITTVIDLLTRPAIAYATVLAILGAFTWQATASFLPAFLEGYHGYSRTTASLLFSAYFLIHGLTQPVSGEVSDTYSRRSALLLTMLLGVVGYTLLVVGSSPLAIGLAVVCIGVAMSWGAPIQSQFMDVLSDSEQGAGFGLVRTVYMGLGSFGSVVTGVLVDVSGWGVAFGLLVGCMGIAAMLLIGGQVWNR